MRANWSGEMRAFQPSAYFATIGSVRRSPAPPTHRGRCGWTGGRDLRGIGHREVLSAKSNRPSTPWWSRPLDAAQGLLHHVEPDARPVVGDAVCGVLEGRPSGPDAGHAAAARQVVDVAMALASTAG